MSEAVVEVTVNGERRQVPAGATVRGMLNHLGVDPERVAVELNRSIVRKAEWERTRVEAGAQVEIVHFVGGG